MDVILIMLGVLALSLTISGLLIARSKSKLGIFLGLVPIIILELWLQIPHIIRNQQCVNAHCALYNLPPGCTYGRESCGEESGLGIFIFLVIGFIELFLFVIGVIIQYVILSRHKKADAVSSDASPHGTS
jgi:uncharacterized membrane protein